MVARRIVLAAIALMMIGGCGVHGSTDSTLRTKDKIKWGGRFALAVTAPHSANSKHVIESVTRLLTGKLLGSGLAKRVVGRRDAADYYLSVELTDISVQWRGSKLVFGAFLGRQGITSNVSLLLRRSNKEIRQATITGNSPADPANPDASLDNAAKALAEEILQYLK